MIYNENCHFILEEITSKLVEENGISILST